MYASALLSIQNLWSSLQTVRSLTLRSTGARLEGGFVIQLSGAAPS